LSTAVRQTGPYQLFSARSAVNPMGRRFMRPLAPIAPRRPWSSGRKNARRDFEGCRRPASGQPCSQVPITSAKTPRLPTTARRSLLLQQTSPQKRPCLSPIVRVAQEIVGGAQVVGGLLQTVGGVVEAGAGVIGAPESGGTSLLAVPGGVANATLGSASVLDGAKLLYAAATGSGNTQSTFSQIGQQYGGEAGGKVGELANLLGQVLSWASSPAKTAEAAIANTGTTALATALPDSDSGCGP
jgi:hypothetical protein